MNAARTAAAGTPLEAFPAGWYGKIPAAGDFVARRIPASFSDPWDRWLQRSVEASRERLGQRWREHFLSMPAWRFFLTAGVAGDSAWAGLMVPSVDSVGRYFPLTIAAALPVAALDLVGTAFAATWWLEELEVIALRAIAPGADISAIDAALAERPFKRAWLQFSRASDDTVPVKRTKPRMLWIPLAARSPVVQVPPELRELAQRMVEPYSLWLAEQSDVLGRSALLCEPLPLGEHYCAMMDGRWTEHGWTRRDA